jgi:hypothetical protein
MTLQIERVRYLAFGLPLVVVLSSIVLACSSLLQNNPMLALGITIDLTLSAPLLYLFLIWKKDIPKISVIPVFVLGKILANLLIPKHQQDFLLLVQAYLLPIVELGVVSFIIYKVHLTVKTFKIKSKDSIDFYEVLKFSASEALGMPWVGKILASEIGMVYYAFFSWKKVKITEGKFTNYKGSGILAVLWVFILIMLVETFVVHILLEKWSVIFAWVLTGGSIYGALLFFSHIKALQLRPIVIKDGILSLKCGLFGDAKIELKSISKIVETSGDINEPNLKVEKLAFLKELEEHNLALYFDQTQILEKPYGITKECDVILIYVDEKAKFLEAIRQNNK